MRGDQESIKRYLKGRGIALVPADPDVVAAYEKSSEKCVAEIDRLLREQAIIAAQFRRRILF